MNRLAIALGIALSWPVLSFGQMRGAGAMVPGIGIPHMGISNGLTISFGAPRGTLNHPLHHNFFPNAFFFDPGFWYEAAPAVSASPSIVVIPIEMKKPEEPREEAKSAEPLFIERRGDQFVRSSGGDMDNRSSMPTEDTTSADIRKGHKQATGAESPVELPSAVLVFRDGHREETSNYAIVGNDVYLYFDSFTAGSWFKKIQLAELDLIATATENRERGSKFQLPHGPNEIVVRP
jgi:hypothetical protein